MDRSLNIHREDSMESSKDLLEKRKHPRLDLDLPLEYRIWSPFDSCDFCEYERQGVSGHRDNKWPNLFGASIFSNNQQGHNVLARGHSIRGNHYG